MSLLPLVKPCLLQWEGGMGGIVSFRGRLSYFTGVTEGLEPRPPWPLKGKVGTASARELDLAETGSVKDVGLGQPSGLWDLRGHTPFPYFSD